MPETIIAGPDDGLDPDAPDPDDDLDPDDELEEDDEPVREPPKPKTEPIRTYEELAAENERLKNATRRNNRELAQRRHVQEWMESHGIEDFDAWLSQQGIDRDTATRTATPTPAPNGNGHGDSETARQAALDLERERAKWEEERASLQERHGALTDAMKRAAVVAALAKAKFNGTEDKALRVVDLSKVTVGDGGEVTGASEAVESLRTEIPEWFRERGRPPTRSGGEDVDGGRRPAPAPKKMTWEQKAIDQMIPGAGRR